MEKGKDDTPQAKVLLVDSAPTSNEASPSASQEDLAVRHNHDLLSTFEHLAVHPSFQPESCEAPPVPSSAPPDAQATSPPYSTLTPREKWAAVGLITLAGMFSWVLLSATSRSPTHSLAVQCVERKHLLPRFVVPLRGAPATSPARLIFFYVLPLNCPAIPSIADSLGVPVEKVTLTVTYYMCVVAANQSLSNRV